MITDARVLQEEFIPQEVEHRDPEVNALSGALAPLTDADYPDPALLTGPSGAGKTCIAQFTLDRLREEVLDLNTQYVNCWQHYTGYRTLLRILEGINRAVDVHRRSTPRDELVDRLRAYDGPQYVVILDEVDQLREPEVLYDLLQIRRVTPVLIANREPELLANVDDRVVSRLQAARRIRFDQYSLDELVSILSARVRWGLREDAADAAVLERVADAAAGDARVAIGVLRSAARRAKQQGLGEVTVDTVEASIPDARATIEQRTVDKLTPHQRTLYEVLDECGELSPGELYDRYRERVDDPKSRRTVRKYCTKLEHYNLVVAEGEKRGRTYRPAR